MRPRRWYYIVILAVLSVLGFTGVMSGYEPLVIGLFLICVVLFIGGFLRETSNKIE